LHNVKKELGRTQKALADATEEKESLLAKGA
jgi:hypothetical protein